MVVPALPKNIFEWKCIIITLKIHNIEADYFFLKVIFPKNYFNYTPEVCFITQIYHINMNHMPYGYCHLGQIIISILN